MNAKNNEIDMTLEARLGRIEETVRTLCNLLQQETMAVEAVNLPAFAKLQESKNALFDLYQLDIRATLSRKNDLKSLPEAAKAKVLAWEKDLAAARNANMVVLERAGKSFGRLRDRVANLAKETVLRKTALYGADGARYLSRNKSISMGIQDRV